MFKIEVLTTADNKNAYYEAKDMIEAQRATKYLGSGLYGKVYAVPDKNIVYKISSLDSTDGYFEYIRVLSKQKTHNPYTPKIYGVRVIKGGGRKMLVVAMEKLTPLSAGNAKIARWISDKLEDDDYDGVRSEAPKERGIKVTLPKPLSNVLGLLKKAHKNARGESNWDLHNGNFMQRGKQVVCTDPLA